MEGGKWKGRKTGSRKRGKKGKKKRRREGIKEMKEEKEKVTSLPSASQHGAGASSADQERQWWRAG